MSFIMTTEEYNRRRDNGKDKLGEIVVCLNNLNESYLDDEAITYSPNNYSFRVDDFRDTHFYLDMKAGSNKKDNSDHFSESLAYFNLGGVKFIWRLLIGQGSAHQLHRPSDWIPYDETMEIKL